MRPACRKGKTQAYRLSQAEEALKITQARFGKDRPAYPETGGQHLGRGKAFVEGVFFQGYPLFLGLLVYGL